MEKQGLFKRLSQGLAKTRSGILGSVFSGSTRINEELYEELEEALIMADVGAQLSSELVEKLKGEVKSQKLNDTAEAKAALVKIIADYMKEDSEFLQKDKNAVLLMVGVNGVGKTTSIGKLAYYYKKEGRKPMLAAADTFRAAAAQQLEVWAKRAEVPFVRHDEGSDPAAVVFDAIVSCKSKRCDMLICDTAGRLHNKKNLMMELEKISRVISREMPDAQKKVMLVLDATTGRNAIEQAKAFALSSGLTDVMLTKLDGTAKGGAVISIKESLCLPVRFVGLGEGIDCIEPFDANEFASALFE